MTIKTTLEQLEAVQAAIEKAEAAQAYARSNGAGSSFSKTSPDLKVLYDRERELLTRYQMEQGTIAPRTYAGQGGKGE